MVILIANLDTCYVSNLLNLEASTSSQSSHSSVEQCKYGPGLGSVTDVCCSGVQHKLDWQARWHYSNQLCGALNRRCDCHHLVCGDQNMHGANCETPTACDWIVRCHWLLMKVLYLPIPDAAGSRMAAPGYHSPCIAKTRILRPTTLLD